MPNGSSNDAADKKAAQVDAAKKSKSNTEDKTSVISLTSTSVAGDDGASSEVASSTSAGKDTVAKTAPKPAEAADEFGKKKTPAQPRIVKKREFVSAVGDGNCAFNAFALAFADKIAYFKSLIKSLTQAELKTKAPGIHKLLTLCMQTFRDANFTSAEEMLLAIEELYILNPRVMQTTLAPVLRLLAIDEVERIERLRLNVQNGLTQGMLGVLRDVKAPRDDARSVAFHTKLDSMRYHAGYDALTAALVSHDESKSDAPSQFLFRYILTKVFPWVNKDKYASNDKLHQFQEALFSAIVESIENQDLKPVLDCLNAGAEIRGLGKTVEAGFKSGLGLIQANILVNVVLLSTDKFGDAETKAVLAAAKKILKKKPGNKPKDKVGEASLAQVLKDAKAEPFTTLAKVLEDYGYDKFIELLNHSGIDLTQAKLKCDTAAVKAVRDAVGVNDKALEQALNAPELKEAIKHCLENRRDIYDDEALMRLERAMREPDEKTACQKLGISPYAFLRSDVEREKLRDEAAPVVLESLQDWEKLTTHQKVISLRIAQSIMTSRWAELKQVLLCKINQLSGVPLEETMDRKEIVKAIRTHVEKLDEVVQELAENAVDTELAALSGSQPLVEEKTFKSKYVRQALQDREHEYDRRLASQAEKVGQALTTHIELAKFADTFTNDPVAQDVVDSVLDEIKAEVAKRYVFKKGSADKSSQQKTWKSAAEREASQALQYLSNKGKGVPEPVKAKAKKLVASRHVDAIFREEVEAYEKKDSQFPSAQPTRVYTIEESLQRWWLDEGLKIYCNHLNEPAKKNAKGANSNEWGGEEELARLCELFGVGFSIETPKYKMPYTDTRGNSVVFEFRNPSGHYYAKIDKFEQVPAKNRKHASTTEDSNDQDSSSSLSNAGKKPKGSSNRYNAYYAAIGLVATVAFALGGAFTFALAPASFIPLAAVLFSLAGIGLIATAVFAVKYIFEPKSKQKNSVSIPGLSSGDESSSDLDVVFPDLSSKPAAKSSLADDGENALSKAEDSSSEVKVVVPTDGKVDQNAAQLKPKKIDSGKVSSSNQGLFSKPAANEQGDKGAKEPSKSSTKPRKVSAAKGCSVM